MLDVLIDHLEQHERPHIIFHHQRWVRWNTSAQALFQSPTADEFQQLVADIDWHRNGEQPLFAAQQAYIGRLNHNGDYSVMSLAPVAEAPDSERVRMTLSRLQDLTLSLAEAPSLDALFRQAVEGGRAVFSIDRIGIMLIDPDTQKMTGTYGTDPHGNVVDERHFVGEVPKLAEVQHVLNRRDYVAYWPDIALRYNDEVISQGWSAMVALWDNDQPIGWIACDNLLSCQPMASWQRQLIALYGAALSQVIRRKRAEISLRQANESLEQTVQVRTQALRDKLDELAHTRDELIEAEKLASLGGMVTGVAHEIGTPLGNANMACSWFESHLAQLDDAVASGRLTKSALDEFLQSAKESADILASNLGRSTDLLKSFRALAVEQLDEREVVINLHQWFEQLTFSFAHLLKKHGIVVSNDIDPSIRMRTNPGLIAQIITNLIQNCVTHAFDNTAKPMITVSAKPAGDARMHIFFADNGKGVQTDHINKIFDPFFTTRRAQGGSGLGLNIVYNIVTGKLGGQIQARQGNQGGLEYMLTIAGALPYV